MLSQHFNSINNISIHKKKTIINTKKICFKPARPIFELNKNKSRETFKNKCVVAVNNNIW